MTTQRAKITPINTVDHTHNLLGIYHRTLQVLEEQAALYGATTPPHVTMQIEEVRATISALENMLAADVPAQVSQGAAPDIEHRLQIMVATVQATVAEVSHVKRDLSQRIVALRELMDIKIGDMRTDLTEELRSLEERLKRWVAYVIVFILVLELFLDWLKRVLGSK